MLSLIAALWVYALFPHTLLVHSVDRFSLPGLILLVAGFIVAPCGKADCQGKKFLSRLSLLRSVDSRKDETGGRGSSGIIPMIPPRVSVSHILMCRLFFVHFDPR